MTLVKFTYSKGWGLGVTLSIPLFSIGATSLSPYKDLKYLCHHRPPVYRRTLKAARVACDRKLLFLFV